MGIFALGDRVIVARNLHSPSIEPGWLVGNAGKITHISDYRIGITIVLTHPNGHPHHQVGGQLLVAADELEHLD